MARAGSEIIPVRARIRAVGFAASLALLGACGSPPPQETTPAPAADPPVAAEAEPTEAPGVTAVAPGAIATVSLTGTPASVGQNVAISVTNRGASTVELRSALAVEVLENGAFVPSRSALSLRYDCAHEASACVTLAPGAELVPPEWLGTWGDTQCVCTRCGPVDPGTYRFVATTCDGASRVEGTAFTIAP